MVSKKRTPRTRVGKRRRTLRAIHKNIRTLREVRGWSQEQLAERCSVDKTAVSQWERGISAPKGERLPLVAETTIDDLYREAA
jgi:transcriptional regulator with XRE-family HTH domain